MASRKPALSVSIAEGAEDDLWEIWDYNCRRYDSSHADNYLSFLRTGMSGLSTEYSSGRRVERFPGLRSITLRRSESGDGHIVIYKVDEDAGQAIVLFVYHTKMDVQSRLKEDRRRQG